MGAAIRLEGVTKRFGRELILDDADLEVRGGSFTVLLGAPASGKSTLLRLLMGLETPNTGRIFLRGEDVTKTPAGKRNIGYVPQSFALYPHLSVFDNIAYPLKLARATVSEIQTAVHEAAASLGIGDLLQKSPEQLSGGQKQRVAIARGVVKQTEIFVLDDPLTGLDFKLREQLFDDFRALQEGLGATFVYATADTLEAQMLAEDVQILAGGRVVEAGSFETVYRAPQHVETMALLGFPKANVFAGKLEPQGSAHLLTTPLFELPVTGLTSADVDENYSKSHGGICGEVQVAVRPQDVQLGPAPDAGWVGFAAVLTLIENLGGEFVAYLQARDLRLTSVVRYDALAGLVEGPVTVAVAPENVVLYRAGRRLARVGREVTARG